MCEMFYKPPSEGSLGICETPTHMRRPHTLKPRQSLASWRLSCYSKVKSKEGWGQRR